jgi:hypothetical protein
MSYVVLPDPKGLGFNPQHVMAVILLRKKKLAEAAAKKKAEEEAAKKQAEEDARLRAEEEARIRAQVEAQQKAQLDASQSISMPPPEPQVFTDPGAQTQPPAPGKEWSWAEDWSGGAINFPTQPQTFTDPSATSNSTISVPAQDEQVYVETPAPAPKKNTALLVGGGIAAAVAAWFLMR